MRPRRSAYVRDRFGTSLPGTCATISVRRIMISRQYFCRHQDRRSRKSNQVPRKGMTPMTTDPGRISRRAAMQGIAAVAGTGLIARPAVAQGGAKLLFMEPFDLAFEYMHEMNGVV